MNKFNCALKKVLIFSFIIFSISGCKTIQPPVEIQPTPDYTKEDVIENEAKQIRKLLEVDPVKALWRSSFIKENKIYDECISNMELQIERSIEQKDIILSKQLYNSLVHCGYKDTKNYAKKIMEIKEPELPGSHISANKIPKNSADCVNATVTVWVDKGYKVQKGAGILDIVIGSGFFIDERGYIITNYHVIKDLVDPTYEGFSRLYIRLSSDTDTKIPAKVIGYDSIVDLALLKVELEPQFVLELGSSSDLSVGDTVSAIGTPVGFEGTVTTGVISATNRSIFNTINVFQLDAAVNSGNSGGPLIDKNRKVQGIVFAGIMQYQGLNFAIPVEYLKMELPYLFNGGEILHSWIGAYGNTFRQNSKKKGLELFYIKPGATAKLAGFEEGDIITKIDNLEIKSLENYHFNLLAFTPGTIVKFTYLDKEGREKTKNVYLEKRPEKPALEFYNSDLKEDSFIPLFGMKLTPSSTTNRKSYTITKVIKGSFADEYGFSENDPITINDVKIDYENKCILLKIRIQNKKKGYLDMPMIIGTSFDSSNYL